MSSPEVGLRICRLVTIYYKSGIIPVNPALCRLGKGYQIMLNPFIDRKYRLPRIWSNRELEKFSDIFSGDIANVSGWTDVDKEGKHYKDYFKNARNYTITNYKTEARGIQGYNNEIFLDLENELPKVLINKFDLVFNHTVLEHTYNVRTAFQNLCLLSKDIVILVVPFLQQMHGPYGDYWRFTPSAIKKMFEDNGMSVLYLSYNNHRNASIYIFSIATKNRSAWKDKIDCPYLENQQPTEEFGSSIGRNAILNIGHRLIYFLTHKIRP